MLWLAEHPIRPAIRPAKMKGPTDYWSSLPHAYASIMNDVSRLCFSFSLQPELSRYLLWQVWTRTSSQTLTRSSRPCINVLQAALVYLLDAKVTCCCKCIPQQA